MSNLVTKKCQDLAEGGKKYEKNELDYAAGDA